MMIYALVLTKLVLIFSVKQNKEGKSPLHIAAMHGRFTGSQILIQNGNISFKKIFTQHPVVKHD